MLLILPSHDGNFKQFTKRIVLNCYKGEIEDTYTAVMFENEKDFKEGKYFGTYSWRYAKEISEIQIKTPLQLEFEELQNKIKELQIKADEIKTKL